MVAFVKEDFARSEEIQNADSLSRHVHDLSHTNVGGWALLRPSLGDGKRVYATVARSDIARYS